MNINIPFFITLFIVVTVMLSALYLTREDKEKPWRQQLREFFGLKTRSH